MRDYVGSDNLENCVSAQFVPDRFNNANSALYLNNGYCAIPTDVYFLGGDFTFSAWIKVINFPSWSCPFDCGNTAYQDNVVFWLTPGNIYLEIYDNGVDNNIIGNTPLTLNQWDFLVGVLSGTNLIIYVNGVEMATNPSAHDPLDISRTHCYIGYCNSGNGNIYAYMDEIRLYTRALSPSEIVTLMNIP